jgi:ribonucleoside-diphosphate reductase alpha chain
LGSINLAEISSIEELSEITNLASMFLYCGTITGEVPSERVKKVRDKNRRLGLGLMGLHEWLLVRNYPYKVTEELHNWLSVWKTASEAGANLLADLLSLPRPVAYRAIAPTGTIGIIAGTTTGIEPIYAVAYKRRYYTNGGINYQYVIDGTAKILIDRYGIDPYKIETAYSMATDVEKRISFQADIQDYVDQSISSTLNLPAWGSEYNNEDTVMPLAKVIQKYSPRLRGLTVYPDGARGGQPLESVDYNVAIKNSGIDYIDVCTGGVCGV